MTIIKLSLNLLGTLIGLVYGFKIIGWVYIRYINILCKCKVELTRIKCFFRKIFSSVKLFITILKSDAEIKSALIKLYWNIYRSKYSDREIKKGASLLIRKVALMNHEKLRDFTDRLVG